MFFSCEWVGNTHTPHIHTYSIIKYNYILYATEILRVVLGEIGITNDFLYHDLIIF